MKKMYLVHLNCGDFEDSYTLHLFVTADKEYAENYVAKFNSMLIKWNQYFNQFKDPYGWIDEKYYDTWIYERHSQIKDYNCAFVNEVEVR